MDDIQEANEDYRWQSGYEKTWEAIKETDDGFLDTAFAEAIANAKRKQKRKRSEQVKLGLMRHVYLIIDFSEAMSNQDLKPTRLLCCLKILEYFLTDFFDQNPISQLGVIILRNKRAEKIADLTGSGQKHVNILNTLLQTPLAGETSIQNGLEMACKYLRLLPSHTSKEVVMIFGSLTTCDATKIDVTIEKLKKESIRCSIIGLSAEVNICRQICKQTGGNYYVVLDDAHFKDLMMSFVYPPPAASSIKCSLIKMGFPHQMESKAGENLLALCMCHLDVEGECKISTEGHYCPQCNSKYCYLPVECKVCGLTLVTAPHLARSYHHLFPIKPYNEIQFDQQVDKCFSCQKILSTEKTVYNCATCDRIFCRDCDEFIHDILHVCPGCSIKHNNTER